MIEDFIVHVPGTGNNYAVVEVKSRLVDGEGIRDGVQKLVQFRELGYQRALYLFYGMGAAEAVHGWGGRGPWRTDERIRDLGASPRRFGCHARALTRISRVGSARTPYPASLSQTAE